MSEYEHAFKLVLLGPAGRQLAHILLQPQLFVELFPKELVPNPHAEPSHLAVGRPASSGAVDFDPQRHGPDLPVDKVQERPRGPALGPPAHDP